MTSSPKLTRFRNMASFAYVSGLLLWFLIHVFSVTHSAMQNQLASYEQKGIAYNTEFAHYIALSKTVFADRTARLYGSSTVPASPLNTTGMVGKFEVVDISPISYFLMLPLAPLPIDAAQLIWSFSTFLLGLFACCVIAKSFGASNLLTILISISVAASAPSILTIYLGQTSWCLVFAAALYLWAFVKKKDFIAGAFLALAAVKFQHLPFLLIPLLATGRWRIFASATAAGLILLSLIGSTCGFQNLLDYPAFLLKFEHTTYFNGESMVCIRGLFERLLPRSLALPAASIVMLTALGWLFWLWRKVRGSETQAMLAINCTLSASLVFAAHCFCSDILLLAIVASFFFSIKNRTDLSELPALPFMTWLLILEPVTGWVFYYVGWTGIPELYFDLPWNIAILSASTALFFQYLKAQRSENSLNPVS